MKRFVLYIAMVCFFTSIQCYGQWQNTFSEAQKQATSTKKNIVLVFSGSDWCIPCIKLDKTIFQSQEFKAVANQWLLYKADFPRRKKINEAIKKENQDLMMKYNPQGIYPMVLVFNSSQKILGIVKNHEITPQAYIKVLQSFK